MTTPTLVKLNARISAADRTPGQNDGPNTSNTTVIAPTNRRKTVHLQLASGLSTSNQAILARKTEQPVIVFPRSITVNKQQSQNLQEELTLNLTDRQDSIDSAGRRRPAAQPLRDSSDEDSDTSASANYEGADAGDSTSDALSPVSPCGSSSSSSVAESYGGQYFNNFKERGPPRRQQKKAQRVNNVEQLIMPVPPQLPCPVTGRRHYYKTPPPQPVKLSSKPNLYSDSVPMRARNLPPSFYQCPNQPPTHSPALGLLPPPRVLPPLSTGTFGNNSKNPPPLLPDDLGGNGPTYKTRVIPKNPDLLNKLFEKCKTKESVCKFSVPLNVAKKFISRSSSNLASVDTVDEVCTQDNEPFLLHHDSGTSMLPELRASGIPNHTSSNHHIMRQLTLGCTESERNASLLSEMVSNL